MPCGGGRAVFLSPEAFAALVRVELVPCGGGLLALAAAAPLVPFSFLFPFFVGAAGLGVWIAPASPLAFFSILAFLVGAAGLGVWIAPAAAVVGGGGGGRLGGGIVATLVVDVTVATPLATVAVVVVDVAVARPTPSAWGGTKASVGGANVPISNVSGLPVGRGGSARRLVNRRTSPETALTRMFLFFLPAVAGALVVAFTAGPFGARVVAVAAGFGAWTRAKRFEAVVLILGDAIFDFA